MMLNQWLIIIVLTNACAAGLAQNGRQSASSETDSIVSAKKKLAAATEDTTRSWLTGKLGLYYEGINTDSSLKYGMESLNLAEKSGYPHYETRALAGLSGVLRQQGKFANALDVLFKSLEIAQKHNLKEDIARSYRRLGILYLELENYSKAGNYCKEALDIDDKLKLESSAQIDHMFLASIYEKFNNLDSALAHAMKAKDISLGNKHQLNEILGNIYFKKNDYPSAYSLYIKCLNSSLQVNDFGTASKACNGLTDLYLKLNKIDSATCYAKKGFELGQKASFKKEILKAANTLAEIYDSTQPALALTYLKIAIATKDSLFGAGTIETIQSLISQEQARQKELVDAKITFQNRLKWYGALTSFLALLLILFIFYRNNKQKQKANVLLQYEKQNVEKSLTELKSTQAQLIQSEKMASLGELTAGIAHEIQNPLNFVNNFSEVNAELINELSEIRSQEEEVRDEELGGRGKRREEEDAIISDLKSNSEKINHHGQRASSIVKSMLEHSRKSTGQKVLTDINALADEYLRLSYHGLRARDKNFTADYKSDFDMNLPKIEVVSQDIGRVLLNLINNAFQAVDEKAKKAGSDYKPTVTVSTKSTTDHIEICVSDNGGGIPGSIKDKIFQPFFTTKDTGKGTGLGLSLAYDIVKAHGGTIRVKSSEEEGSNFIIQLPVV